MHLLYKFITLPRKVKVYTAMWSDCLLLPLAFWSAIALRLGTFDFAVEPYKYVFLLIPLVTIPIFLRIGLYRAVIRFFDEKIIFTIILGASLSVLIITAATFMMQVQGLPRSSILIYWFLSVVYITSSRYLARGFVRSIERKSRSREKVAIYGAGSAGLQTALALFSSPELVPILFFDDNPDIQGSSMAGLRVYNPDDAIEILEQFECDQLLFAIPSVKMKRRKDIIQRFEQKGIKLKTIPGINEIVVGKIRMDDIREVGIEDLLGRDPVPPNEDLIQTYVTDKVVMVTGAGGSIGSELVKQILLRKPKKIILFEMSEFSLYCLQSEIKTDFNEAVVVSVLGTVLDQQFLESTIKKHSVDTLYHAAAYKHVPIVEANIISGVQNNVFGTLKTALAAKSCGVRNFVLISTDKAVRPTNVMGATKRIAEMILQALANDPGNKTIYSMVRFGNVLGSSGSVVPLFTEQIKNGGPVTVTHKDITRYFMTIPEATELVLQAAAMSDGGDLFLLDMGEPVKIHELAKKMIHLSGYTLQTEENPNGDIAIHFIGLRPGEKLFEELLIGDDASPTQHPRIMKANEEFIDLITLSKMLEELNKNCELGRTEFVLKNIRSIVKEYQPEMASVH